MNTHASLHACNMMHIHDVMHIHASTHACMCPPPPLQLHPYHTPPNPTTLALPAPTCQNLLSPHNFHGQRSERQRLRQSIR